MMGAINKDKDSESNREYYENGSNQVAEVTAVQLKKLEQVRYFFYVVKNII